MVHQLNSMASGKTIPAVIFHLALKPHWRRWAHCHYCLTNQPKLSVSQQVILYPGISFSRRCVQLVTCRGTWTFHSLSVLVILQIFSFGTDFRSSTVSSQQNRSHLDMYHVQQPSCFLKASVDLNWWIIVSTWNYTFLVDWVPKF